MNNNNNTVTIESKFIKPLKTMKAFHVNYLWTAIRHLEKKRQPSDVGIYEFVSKHYKWEKEECEQRLVKACSDGYIECVPMSVGELAGKSKGSDTFSYRIPSFENCPPLREVESHDWCCFECHQATDETLVECLTCPRVFHENCIRNPGDIETKLLNRLSPGKFIKEQSENSICEPDSSQPDGLVGDNNSANRQVDESIKDELTKILSSSDNQNCVICTLMNCQPVNPVMSDTELNYLLSFVYNRSRTWIPADTFSQYIARNVVLPPPLPVSDLDVFKKLFFIFPVTVQEIDQKIKMNNYRSIDELKQDLLNIQHCIAILYGVESCEFEATKYLIKDTFYEIEELRHCPDCYRHSNEKEDEYWFSRPCTVRHKIVYAKQKGYCYWPAKVIKIVGNKYDVRFFGSKHPRAVIDSNCIKPIETDEKSLKITKSASYNKAKQELMKYYELDGNQESFKFNCDRILTSNTNTKRVKTSARKVPKVSTPKRNSERNNKKLSVEATISSSFSDFNESSNTVNDSNQTMMNASSSQDLNSTNEVSNSMSETDGDISEVNKRKRKLSRPTMIESEVSDDSNESTISDYISDKKVKKGKNAASKGSKNGNNKGSKSTKTQRTSQGSENAPENNVQDINMDNIFIQMNGTETRQEVPVSPQIDSLNTSNENLSNVLAHSPRIKSRLEKTYCDSVELLKRAFENMEDPIEIKKLALDTLQKTIDREKLQRQRIISANKKKQWCFNCEEEAYYHCCWNTAYCSKECQEKHWRADHKLHCGRKKQQQQQ